MKGKTIGFALCGSFCTFSQAIPQMEALRGEGADIVPIMSQTAAYTDTRFGRAEDFRAKIEDISGRRIITTIHDAEPIGPKSMLDLLVIAPCTGNTLSKLALAVTDTSVTMAAKAHLRNGKPLLIALATNDGLAGSGANLGTLLRAKSIYFVPLRQDGPLNKPASLVAVFEKLVPAAQAALEGRQLQPLMEGPPQ